MSRLLSKTMLKLLGNNLEAFLSAETETLTADNAARLQSHMTDCVRQRTAEQGDRKGRLCFNGVITMLVLVWLKHGVRLDIPSAYALRHAALSAVLGTVNVAVTRLCGMELRSFLTVMAEAGNWSPEQRLCCFVCAKYPHQVNLEWCMRAYPGLQYFSSLQALLAALKLVTAKFTGEV